MSNSMEYSPKRHGLTVSTSTEVMKGVHHPARRHIYIRVDLQRCEQH